MKTQEQIILAKNKLIDLFNPKAIYLFGSYAWGVPTNESDLDLLVIIDHFDDSRHEMLVSGHLVLSCLDMPKDLLIYSVKEFNERAQLSSSLCNKIKLQGIKLYCR